MPKKSKSELTILIPMAGRGSRFVEQGYKVPKPFITFHDRMMIEHVLEGLTLPEARYILVIQKDVEVRYSKELKKIRSQWPVHYLTVDSVTEGAACTALVAQEKIKPNAPLLIADSDTIFQRRDIQAFLEDARLRELDGSLVTFESKDPCYSYAELGEDGFVRQTREKEVISSHAIAGLYYFGKGLDFVDAATDMVRHGTQQKEEYYMSAVYNGLVARERRVGIFTLPKDKIVCVGTPGQLEEYLRG